MENVVQVYNETDMSQAVRSRRARNTIGHAIGRAYKNMPWHVDVNIEGGIATITCPKISVKHGMVIHLTRDIESMERKAVQLAGELLERFNVNRTTGNFGYLKRNIAGEALGAAAGEQ
ncbi:MAG: hypothetical protein DRR42_19640 [Gammaproteobacteria bacterium]|nr:MAG: hypothetical protein DRR42_19640 [Gammaproteobacteria bacterium]